MADYDPKSLPPVDAVEIVDIRCLSADRVSQYMQAAWGAPHVRVEGDAAQRFADAWRGLPPGLSARCHIPPIGLRFFVDQTVHLEASVCWECDNLFGLSEGKNLFYAFDSSSAPPKELFTLSQESLGIENPER